MSEVADVLDRAVDVLETHGWTQGSVMKVIDGKPRFCAVGAVRVATGFIGLNGLTRDVSAMCLSAEVEDTLMGYVNGLVPAWNDHVLRDKFEVIDAMKSLAKDLRNRGNG